MNTIKRFSAIISICILSGTVNLFAQTIFTVTNNNDAGSGSLRQAIIDANNNSGADIINFEASVSGTIILTDSLLINDDVTINGPGNQVLAIDGGNDISDTTQNIVNNFTVFCLSASNSTINNLTIQKGYRGIRVATGKTTILNNCIITRNYHPDNGGGILVNGVCTMNSCIISKNYPCGITNRGDSLIMNNCTVSENDGASYGTGIVNDSSAVLNMNNCRMNNNGFYASFGAAILNNYGNIFANNCTFNNNSGMLNFGGSIENYGGNLQMTNCTMADTGVFWGGGWNSAAAIFIDAGNASLINCTIAFTTGAWSAVTQIGGNISFLNSILAGNPDLPYGDAYIYYGGTATSYGHNICQDSSMLSILTAPGDTIYADPLLSPLADNGGLTKTCALQSGSPAINAGTSAGAPTADQRGYGRNGITDIGAYESCVAIIINNPQTICANSSYSINGHNYTLQGTYNDTLQTYFGCDSIIITQLTVNPALSSNNPQTICEGSYYTINGNTYTITGNYNDTLTSSTGCDSIVITQLTVNPILSSLNPQTICDGATYTFNGNTYTISGNYNDTLTSSNGCDSIVTTQLTVNPILSSNNPQIICEGSFYSINGNTYTIEGNYNDTLASTTGCDSIVTTQLTVNPILSSLNPQTICDGASYSFNGNTYSIPGNYNDTLVSLNGCDSIITTQLSVQQLPVVTLTIDKDTLCFFESPITLNGLPVNGTYSGTGITGNTFDPQAAGVGTHIITYTYSDSINCSDSAVITIFVDICGGIINEAENNPLIKINPNPSEGVFKIDIGSVLFVTDKMNIEVYNIMGEVIYTSSVFKQEKNKELTLSNPAKGIYFIKLSNGISTYIEKMIVQ